MLAAVKVAGCQWRRLVQPRRPPAPSIRRFDPDLIGVLLPRLGGSGRRPGPRLTEARLARIPTFRLTSVGRHGATGHAWGRPTALRHEAPAHCPANSTRPGGRTHLSGRPAPDSRRQFSPSVERDRRPARPADDEPLRNAVGHKATRGTDHVDRSLDGYAGCCRMGGRRSSGCLVVDGYAGRLGGLVEAIPASSWTVMPTCPSRCRPATLTEGTGALRHDLGSRGRRQRVLRHRHQLDQRHRLRQCLFGRRLGWPTR